MSHRTAHYIAGGELLTRHPYSSHNQSPLLEPIDIENTLEDRPLSALLRRIGPNDDNLLGPINFVSSSAVDSHSAHGNANIAESNTSPESNPVASGLESKDTLPVSGKRRYPLS